MKMHDFGQQSWVSGLARKAKAMVVKTWHASRPLSAATAEHSHAVLASLVASFVIFCHILTYFVSLFSPPYDLLCLPYP